MKTWYNVKMNVRKYNPCYMKRTSKIQFEFGDQVISEMVIE